jgi:hypothetical protein
LLALSECKNVNDITAFRQTLHFEKIKDFEFSGTDNLEGLEGLVTLKELREQIHKEKEYVKIIQIPAGKMIKSPEFIHGNEDHYQQRGKFWENVVNRHTDISPVIFNYWI